jgi:protein Tex
MTLYSQISKTLQIPHQQVENTVRLLKEDNTIPFIARYRKEQTGNLDEEQIRNIRDELQYLENLQDRRKTVLKTIQEQGKLTGELKKQILNATTMTEVEDLYQPYRPKRRTRAMVAKEKGLDSLADMIIEQKISEQSIKSLVSPFLSENVPDIDSALQGASDIVAERMSENTKIRQTIREKVFAYGRLHSEKISDADDDRQIFQLYYEFELPVKHLRPHQILAINRGENEKVLRVTIVTDEKDWRTAIRGQFPPDRRSLLFSFLNAATEDAAKRLLLPAIERDIRRNLTEKAEDHAIEIFSRNLQALLSHPPLSGHVTLAIDPGFRTGSKVVVIDSFGKLMEYSTIYPHPPQNKKEEATKKITSLVDKHNVTLIVIGNGTASRETEQFIAEITKADPNLHYLITSEAGASVYSASNLARKEFPNLDVSMRGAVSIGRRVQDPLAELVKINPKSIGVGLYQHDVNQPKLSNALDDVVESVVNAVGVEINSASPALLSHIAGIGPSLATKIVKHREEHGPFKNRNEFFKVPGMGPKTFEQSAGFLRIRDGDNPLDSTAIHPESYSVALKIFEHLDLELNSDSNERKNAVYRFKKFGNHKKLAQELNVGQLTLKDILDEIARPGRDPRENLPKPLLRKDILSMDDISPGVMLKGTIRNIVDFGAFVDIGVKVDGLLHQSRITSRTILKVGEIIDVIVLSIDRERNRIALDMMKRDH